jgi:hypothetical protein
MIVVIVSEISSKKPMDKIRPKENSRVRIIVKMALRGLAFPSQITFYASSFVVRIRLMPAMKNIRPSTPKMTRDLISWVPPEFFKYSTAAKIRLPIPSTVSKAPKILFRFMIFIFKNPGGCMY